MNINSSFIGKGQLDPVQVRLHRIEVDDRPLNGWIHVVITIDKESPFHKDGFGILLMNGRISLGDDSSVQYHRYVVQKLGFFCIIFVYRLCINKGEVVSLCTAFQSVMGTIMKSTKLQ